MFKTKHEIVMRVQDENEKSKKSVKVLVYIKSDFAELQQYIQRT